MSINWPLQRGIQVYAITQNSVGVTTLATSSWNPRSRQWIYNPIGKWSLRYDGELPYYIKALNGVRRAIS